ncbi:MAG TPA: hypothetical protein VEA38_02805 [Terriglobales bacterium]|nr:hypothetical protein [Terriglobales bacterium]
MGNDPGRPLVKGQVSRVIIEIKGPLESKPAKAFKRDLATLIKRHRKKAGGLVTRVRKARAGAKRKTAKRAKKR